MEDKTHEQQTRGRVDCVCAYKLRNMSVHREKGAAKMSKYFFFQAEDGIRDVERSRGLGDVYKRQDYWGI